MPKPKRPGPTSLVRIQATIFLSLLTILLLVTALPGRLIRWGVFGRPFQRADGVDYAIELFFTVIILGAIALVWFDRRQVAAAKRREEERWQQSPSNPAIQEIKYQKLKAAFNEAVFQRLGDGLGRSERQVIEAALDRLARAFTFGSMIRVADANEILIVVHNSAAVDPRVKQADFRNHFGVLNLLQDVFLDLPECWFDTTATKIKHRYPPGAIAILEDFKIESERWERGENPYRPTPAGNLNVIKTCSGCGAPLELRRSKSGGWECSSCGAAYG